MDEDFSNTLSDMAGAEGSDSAIQIMTQPTTASFLMFAGMRDFMWYVPYGHFEVDGKPNIGMAYTSLVECNGGWLGGQAGVCDPSDCQPLHDPDPTSANHERYKTAMNDENIAEHNDIDREVNEPGKGWLKTEADRLVCWYDATQDKYLGRVNVGSDHRDYKVQAPYTAQHLTVLFRSALQAFWMARQQKSSPAARQCLHQGAWSAGAFKGNVFLHAMLQFIASDTLAFEKTVYHDFDKALAADGVNALTADNLRASFLSVAQILFGGTDKKEVPWSEFEQGFQRLANAKLFGWGFPKYMPSVEMLTAAATAA